MSPTRCFSRGLVRLLPLLGLLSWASTAWAAPLRVVTTGDSLTNGYGYLLQQDLADLGIQADVKSVASGGCTSSRYVGLAE